MILERCNQIRLGYMSMCRLFFLSDRRNVLVRWEQINVCDLRMGVTIPSTIDGRAAQTMRMSLGIVVENSRVDLLGKVRTLAPPTVNMTGLAITVRSGKNLSARPDLVNVPSHLGSGIEDLKVLVQDPHSGGGQGGGLVSAVYLSKAVEYT